MKKSFLSFPSDIVLIKVMQRNLAECVVKSRHPNVRRKKNDMRGVAELYIDTKKENVGEYVGKL